MGVEELREEGVWTVRRDINVRPTGRLKITPGVTLKFEHSVGMMVREKKERFFVERHFILHC